jgi:hypothetical protein
MLKLFAFLVGFALPFAAAADARVSEAYGQLPVHFEANRGQAHEDVRFLARGPGYSLYLTGGEAVLALARTARTADVVRMSLVGAAPRPVVSGLDELPGKANYFVGADSAKWRTNVPTYARVHYREVYPGIDLVYYGNQRQLEYDFVVAPGADPRKIVLAFQGADRLEIDSEGGLLLHAAGGSIRQPKPLLYQEIDGLRREIDGAYTLKGAHRVGFEVAAYDASRPLIIDPVLAYSTYLGGSDQDQGFGIAVDPAGNAYATGLTSSSDFPTTAAAVDATFNGGSDVFVTKLDPTGSVLLYSTYLGGGNTDQANGIAVDLAGNAYVTGVTFSVDWPTTTGALDTTFNAGGGDAFVAKLDATGSMLLYSTYLGGSGFDQGVGIAVNSAGNAYVTGLTGSSNFPTTAAAVDTTANGNTDAFVAKLDSAGSVLLYSTYLGGSNADEGHGIALRADEAYVTGVSASGDFPTTAGASDTTFNGGIVDAFVARLDSTGSILLYSTYLGGSGADQGHGIAVDPVGNAYVTGVTSSSDFPTTAGAFDTTFNGSFDAFVTKLDAAGSMLVYATYLGGSGFEQGFGIAVDAAGNAHVTGGTTSSNFPTSAGAVDATLNGPSDAFVTKLDPAASMLLYSTYLGGSGDDQGQGIAVDLAGNAHVTGGTNSGDFPTTAGVVDTTFNGSSDAFVVKIADVAAPATLVLSPAADTNPVGTSHTVTATVRAAGGNPVAGVVVRFTVTGSLSASGSCTTDASGTCSFTYAGPPLPGTDVITAYADSDADNTQDAGEPTGGAMKIWALPVTTPLCEIRISDGGRITALNGDTATFGGNARASATGQASGEQVYQDHGPAQPLTVKSLTVLVLVCEAPRQASIYGQASINGSGSSFYRINVQDLAEPGTGSDTYSILLQNGYTSGQQTLEGGNVQIRRQ